MKLSKEFFNRSPDEVAKELVGKPLVRLKDGKRLVGVITHVDTFYIRDTYNTRYDGIPVSPGIVSLWGNWRGHYFLNIMTKQDNRGATGVNIVGIMPIEGLEAMLENKGTSKLDTNGPGKVTKALGLNDSYDHMPIDGEELYIENESLAQMHEVQAGACARGGAFSQSYWME
jgi:DNA-3-methyladenine glycosylase